MKDPLIPLPKGSICGDNFIEARGATNGPMYVITGTWMYDLYGKPRQRFYLNLGNGELLDFGKYDDIDKTRERLRSLSADEFNRLMAKRRQKINKDTTLDI